MSQPALFELLEAFRAGDGMDLIRESVRMVLQELIEIEAATMIGAARYERTPARVTEWNGGRERVLSTQAGDVSLPIPKLRQGAFLHERDDEHREVTGRPGVTDGTARRDGFEVTHLIPQRARRPARIRPRPSHPAGPRES